MNGKMHGDHGSVATEDVRTEILNPFVHTIELNVLDKIKTVVLTVLLLPVRVVSIALILLSAWILTHIGLFGLSDQDLRSKPITGWRRSLRYLICGLMKALFVMGSFYNVRVLGVRQARTRDAPVLCVAPHSSFFDSIALVFLNAPSVVAKADTARLPIFGQLINYTQPVYVWRDDPNSRQNTIKEIIERATSADWPQILIFPEGTCTNRSCLITFKPGGFYPGVPVQPVTIRYPDLLDTVTWTWEGPSAIKLLWLTLTRLHTSCEIEFLPVYYPSEEEKKDPKLYASNVRNVMAKSLGVPVSDYTYDDCRMLCRAKKLNIPHATSLVEAQKLRQNLGLDANRTECELVDSGKAKNGVSGDHNIIELPQFCQRLGISKADSSSQALFSLFTKKTPGEIDWKEYLLSAVFLSLPGSSPADIVNYAFKVYDESGAGKLNLRAVTTSLVKCASLSHEEGSAIFQQMDADERGWITADDFFKYAKKRPELTFLFHPDKGIRKVKKTQ